MDKLIGLDFVVYLPYINGFEFHKMIQLIDITNKIVLISCLCSIYLIILNTNMYNYIKYINSKSLFQIHTIIDQMNNFIPVQKRIYCYLQPLFMIMVLQNFLVLLHKHIFQLCFLDNLHLHPLLHHHLYN